MSKLKKTILVISIFIFLVFLFSQTTMGRRILFPSWLVGTLRDFLADESHLSIEPYKNGTIILVKPRATGVGDGRYEAGDIVEVRDGQELYQRFGHKPFLGAREIESFLVFYIDRRLTEEENQLLIEPDETESQMTKRRKLGLDYTKFLSDKEISQARRFESIDRIPQIELSDIEEKGERVSVVELPSIFVLKEKYNLNQLFYSVNAQTASTSIIDPDNGSGTDYLSLNAWEAGQQGNLVSQNEIAVAKCRSTGGSADTTAVTIDGWDTDATHYIKIWTDPDEGYRHNGKWDETKYRLKVGSLGDGEAIIRIHEDFVRIKGLQFRHTKADVHAEACVMLYWDVLGDGAEIHIAHNIFKAIYTSGSTSNGYAIYEWQSLSAGESGTMKIWNNIAYNFYGADYDDMGLFWADNGSDEWTVYLYNNTAYNSSRAYATGGATVYAFNNITQGDTGAGMYQGFYGTYHSDSDYNLSDLASNAPGSHSRNSTEVLFADEANDDFHLSSADTGAKGYGIDLSRDANLAFTDDIDGQFRSTHWDIGADEVVRTVVNAPHTNKFTDGLVGYWSFDGRDMDWASTTAEALDRSGQGNNGNVVNFDQNSVTGGVVGQALEFDGVDDYVDVADDDSLTISHAGTKKQMTITAWVYANIIKTSANERMYIVTKGDDANYEWELTVNEGLPTITIHNSEGTTDISAEASNVIQANRWYYLAGTLDIANDEAKIYVNAIDDTGIMYDYDNTVSNTNSNVLIGSRADGPSGTNYYWDGLIDEVRVYNRALSADEIQDLYQAGARKFQVNTPITYKLTDGLVGYWTFNGQDMDWASTTAEVLDRSGQGNNGNVVNFGQEAVTGGKVGQSLEFDGTDDYTSIGDAGSGIKTIAFWMQPDVISKIIDIDGTDQIEINSSSQIVATSFPAATVYVNGVDTSSVTTAWNFVTITDTTGVDASAMDVGRVATGYFNGKLDEVRIYNRVLSMDEITDLYRAGTRLPQIGCAVPSGDGGEPCDSGVYDWSNGDNESFEAGSDSFCTADWTIDDNDGGSIDTYDSAYAHCGSYSLSLTYGATDAMGADITDTSDAIYVRGYVKTGALPDWGGAPMFGFTRYANYVADGYIAAFFIKDDNSSIETHRIRAYYGSGITDEYIELDDEDETIRVEMKCDTGDASYIKVWRWTGSAWAAIETDNGGGDVTVDFTARDNPATLFIFLTEAETGSPEWYFDDFEFSTTAELGDYTCQ